MYNLWEALQTENGSPATREDPHRLASLWLFRVREDVPPAVSSESASPHPLQREAVHMHRLLPNLQTACHPKPAPARPQRQKALSVSAAGLWETVWPEIQSGPARSQA